mmetsp:Transcript_10816/g.25304  ORF Transcript_10816/g.25304 Transcript_10816/m.25304 type:complete len:200 (-) Transcript_10816:232-831(-)
MHDYSQIHVESESCPAIGINHISQCENRADCGRMSNYTTPAGFFLLGISLSHHDYNACRLVSRDTYEVVVVCGIPGSKYDVQPHPGILVLKVTRGKGRNHNCLHFCFRMLVIHHHNGGIGNRCRGDGTSPREEAPCRCFVELLKYSSQKGALADDAGSGLVPPKHERVPGLDDNRFAIVQGLHVIFNDFAHETNEDRHD